MRQSAIRLADASGYENTGENLKLALSNERIKEKQLGTGNALGKLLESTGISNHETIHRFSRSLCVTVTASAEDVRDQPLFTVMGPGCETVQRTKTDGVDLVVGVWKGGRIESQAQGGAPVSIAEVMKQARPR